MASSDAHVVRSAPTYRSTVMDRVFADARTIAIAGPFTTIDENAIRKALQAAEDSSAFPRLAVEPSTNQAQWAYRSGLAERTVVDRLPASETNDLGQLIGAIRARPGTREPLEVIIAGDYLAVDYSHGVGDGQMGVLLVATLAGEIGIDRAPALAQGLGRHATWTALRRHYVSRPAAVRDFWRLRKQNKRPRRDPDGPLHTIENWESGKNSRVDFMAPDRVAELKVWADQQPEKSTSASVSIALWIAALEAEGVAIDESLMILFNSRRYLPSDQQTLHGNFAVGIPVRLPVRPSPAAVAGLMRQVIDSGWPVAILGMSEVKGALRPPKQATDGALGASNTSAEVSDRVRLAVSDLGKLAMFDSKGWIEGDRPPQLAAYLEPDGPDGVSLLISEIANGRTFSVSFCEKVIEPHVVESALRRMCADPVGTLRASQK